MPRETIISRSGRLGPAKAGKQELSPRMHPPFPPHTRGDGQGLGTNACEREARPHWRLTLPDIQQDPRRKAQEQHVILKHSSFPTLSYKHTVNAVGDLDRGLCPAGLTPAPLAPVPGPHRKSIRLPLRHNPTNPAPAGGSALSPKHVAISSHSNPSCILPLPLPPSLSLL